MNLHRCIMIILAAAFVAGCAPATKPRRPTLRARFEQMVFPEVDFKDADAAGVLAYLLNIANVTATSLAVDETAVAEAMRSKGVTGKITIQMKDVTFLDAVRRIARAVGVDYSVSEAGLLFMTKSGVSLNSE